MKSLAVWISSALLVLSTLAVIAGLAYYKYSELEKAKLAPPPPESPIAVVLADAREITYRRNTTMIGSIVSPQSIMLSNEVAGTVRSIQFEPGAIVEQNQVLVELDTSVEIARLESAKARKRIAETTFERTKRAASTGAITANELDIATAELAQATAEMSELQAIIEKKTLRAPFRGRIGLSDTHPGQFLPSGFEIVSLHSIDDFVYVDFMIPQSAADSVQVGQEVKMLIQGQTQVGLVHALDSQADPRSRNLLARAKLFAPKGQLTPGESVKVYIEYGPQLVTAAVPVESLLTAPMQTFVYVATPDAEGAVRARERAVVIGPTQGGWLSIVSGLEVGEQVVADGAFKLRDGSLLTPPPSQEAVPETENRLPETTS
ncbi:efflux RND transporter periplasmic adaptor subunit [Aureliella helgolandensis]|uniref:Toluene efflux pump periplasmic linker protein TtgG n=1 Tax=Aureliella helgolandensis TaxID=2527968 RepID=A0A518GFS5_9BACT|nr:efflux RND transporter periplasmic adaptor subunit [Aureliella helgolandensis]QDV27462.1 Toluene efflux pump periplasmic linker protein TtgG precursor [Aureliella helgolandensis]